MDEKSILFWKMISMTQRDKHNIVNALMSLGRVVIMNTVISEEDTETYSVN